MRRTTFSHVRIRLLLAVGFVLIGACERKAASPKSRGEVVVYGSVDERFARAVLDGYTRRTGVRLFFVGDSEAGKTTGLANRIISESRTGRPRADVFWSSELFHTIRLARMGLLASYASPAATDVPDHYQDSLHRWTATAVRARVIAFDPDVVPAGDLPTRWEQLAEPAIARHVAIANPLFGTTRGHIAALFALWGAERGRAFLHGLRDGGARIEAGNSATVRAVMAGRARFAVTDTDDVWVARRSGASLDMRYLDMGRGGTLLIPCSVALLKGGPHPDEGRNLVDFLVSAEVERMLAQSDSQNVPVRAALRKELHMDWPAESRVSYEAVADAMEEAVASTRDILVR